MVSVSLMDGIRTLVMTFPESLNGDKASVKSYWF